MGLASSTIASVAASSPGDVKTVLGSKSIPTDTKNSTANASRIGRASEAARSPNSLRPTTVPARNAPSAMETPKSLAEPTAMPSAITSTASVKSSRERVAATCSRSQGIKRAPARATTATSAAILKAAMPIAMAAPCRPDCCPPSTAGSTTSAATVSRSSTTTQPTAMCPARVCRSRLSESTRISTTVLATEMAPPKTIPVDHS